MSRWFELQPVDDLAFFTSAPEIHRYPIRVPASPATVWESLQSDASLSAWPTPAIKSLTWTSPRPFGVGTTRDVQIALGLVTVREQFFRWDEGEGYSFFGAACNRPLFRRFAENYVLEADGSGTLLTWTIAIEPNPKLAPVLRLGKPLNHAAFGQVASAAKKFFSA